MTDALTRAKHNRKVGLLFGEIQVFETFHLGPLEWGRLHRWDQQALRYYMIVKAYYREQDLKELENRPKPDRSFNSGMPALSPRRRGRRR